MPHSLAIVWELELSSSLSMNAWLTLPDIGGGLGRCFFVALARRAFKSKYCKKKFQDVIFELFNAKILKRYLLFMTLLFAAECVKNNCFSFILTICGHFYSKFFLDFRLTRMKENVFFHSYSTSTTKPVCTG